MISYNWANTKQEVTLIWKFDLKISVKIQYIQKMDSMDEWTVSSLKLFVLPPCTVILTHFEIVPLIQDQFCTLHREYVGNFKSMLTFE